MFHELKDHSDKIGCRDSSDHVVKASVPAVRCSLCNVAVKLQIRGRGHRGSSRPYAIGMYGANDYANIRVS